MGTCPGSSPLTRGAPRQFKRWVTHEGLIPAHAGSTRTASSTRQPPRAHPRSRGEHCANCWRTLRPQGSSPLTRGALWWFSLCRRLRRLIPAHAGSTNPAKVLGRSVSAHPRSRGEHSLKMPSPRHLVGSSPLTRGARLGGSHDEPTCRLIPAHAGSTDFSVVCHGGVPAHPRSRGEHVEPSSSVNAWRGSSPLTRGARRAEFIGERLEGLIPAHAGSTTFSRS